MNKLGFVAFCALGAALLPACSSSQSTLPDDPEARVEAVQSAQENPSGELTEETAPTVLLRSQSIGQYEKIASFMDAVNAALADGTSSACASVSASVSGGVTKGSGSVDLACSSGGDVTGSVSFTVEVSEGSQLVSTTLSNVCVDGNCMSGILVVSSEQSGTSTSIVTQGSLEGKIDGESFYSEWGISVKTSETGSESNIVIFDDAGDSYVISVAVSSESAEGTLTIKAANGEFSCDFSAGGDAGSCSGSAEFSW